MKTTKPVGRIWLAIFHTSGCNGLTCPSNSVKRTSPSLWNRRGEWTLTKRSTSNPRAHGNKWGKLFALWAFLMPSREVLSDHITYSSDSKVACGQVSLPSRCAIWWPQCPILCQGLRWWLAMEGACRVTLQCSFSLSPMLPLASQNLFTERSKCLYSTWPPHGIYCDPKALWHSVVCFLAFFHDP
jgi:hypothetical protein